MAQHEMLYVFCYDVSYDSARTRVSELLEKHMARVQLSVFEGRMTARSAKSLATAASLHLGPDDSLRCYAISAVGLPRCQVFGPGPLPQTGDYYLL